MDRETTTEELKKREKRKKNRELLLKGVLTLANVAALIVGLVLKLME